MGVAMSATFETGRPVSARTRGLLGMYRDELLRWNRQINLLTRRDPEATAETLIRQCIGAFDLWWGASGQALVGAGGTLRVFDLGSGGGLPGFVWLALLAEHGVVSVATLVEPRVKRAWFLERLARMPGGPTFVVVAARWGETAPPGATPALTADSGDQTPILFTLKALRLPEAAILGGLSVATPALRPAPGVPVELVRFQPTVGVTAAKLARTLEIPAPGERFLAGGWSFEAGERRLLVPQRRGQRSATAAGLLVSRHVIVEGAETDA
jgi:hypothetical protein